jgi:hypothetical protein
VDASARAARIYYSGHSCTYEDLARDRELDEIEKAPFNLEDMVRGFAIESRSAGWDSGVALNRRMRDVRTITHNEISAIADAVAALAPTTEAQN